MSKKRSFIVSIICTCLILLSLLVSCSVTHAQGWYNQDWRYRKQLIIDHTYAGTPLADFPLLVQVTLDSGAQPAGEDIVFTDNTGVKLAHEIEHYDAVSGNLIAWVRIPILSPGVNTILYLYYGNPVATSQENPTAVWDSNYVMAQHLKETSPDIHYDSTSYVNNGTTVVVTNQGVTGQIDGADEFDGVDDYVRVPDSASLQFGEGSFTAEAWIYPHSVTGSSGVRILNNRGTGNGGFYKGWQLKIVNAGGKWSIGASAIDDATGNFKTYTGTTAYAFNQWHQVVMVYEADNELRFYVNGNLDGTLPVGSYGSISNGLPTVIGASLASNGTEGGGPTQVFNGKIDEVRIFNAARNAEWISACYANAANPGSFYLTGSEEVEGVNTPPVLNRVTPADGASGVPVAVTEVRFTIMDSQNDSADYTVTMAPDVIGGVQSGTAISSGTAITIPIVGGPLDYDTTYTWTVDATDPGGSGMVTHRHCSFRTASPPPPPPPAVADFVWWSISDPHLQTDLPGYRSLESAILDSTNGGDQGGESFGWDIATVAGDWTGAPCPTDSDGQDLIEQWIGAGADPNYFYGIIGNHDANTSDNWWFEKWVDPLGQNTAYSLVDNSARPYPVEGAWDHYSFKVGNILYLMLGDRNEGPPPFGRLCSGGYPSGRVSLETYNWWVQQVESHPEHIIITVSHQALLETTVYTGFDEGYEQGIHGGHSWADRRGSSMIYAIDNWTIDGFDENQNYIGVPNFGFVKYLQDHPGAIDLWIHGHTHTDMYPGITFNGRSEVENKYGVTFINTGALTKNHGGPVAPYSRLFNFYDNSNMVLMKTYMHTNEWSGAPEGFYEPAEVLIELDKAFDSSFQAAACEGDIDCDGDCDGSDAALFKQDFGRNQFNDSCESANPCTADYDCDRDVDGSDARLFKQDFGRSTFSQNPCPPCVAAPWCSYP